MADKRAKTHPYRHRWDIVNAIQDHGPMTHEQLLKCFGVEAPGARMAYVEQDIRRLLADGELQMVDEKYHLSGPK